MTNKIQHDQRLVNKVNELKQLKEQTKDLNFAQRVFEVVEDSENLHINNNKDER